MTTYLIYDRFIAMDETTGVLKTYWRIIGNNKNSIVQLRETNPIQTLNPFGQNIASLYVFCRPSQCLDFEKHLLVDIHRQHGVNIKIYKYTKLTTVSTTSPLISNLDNIQNILSLHTQASRQLDVDILEPISKRVVYKFCFNSETIRSDLIDKFKFTQLCRYPDIEMFVPFDDECELFLNVVYPINKHMDTTKYTYMTVISNHYMSLVQILETLYGLIQLVSSTNIVRNVMTVTSREPIKDLRTITDMFLNYVPVIDIIVGRVYENENCIEYNSAENAITFILLKIFIRQRLQFVVFINSQFLATELPEITAKYVNVIPCNNESDLITSFFNLYTNGLISKSLQVDIHFIFATPRYKSNSCVIARRIIRNNMWSRFSTHCIVSEDGRCVRFNRNSIILFDNMEKTGIVTNYRHIDNRVVYLPELYNDSSVGKESSIQTHLHNIRPEYASKYTDLVAAVDRDPNYRIPTLNLFDLVVRIVSTEKDKPIDYNLVLESIIELSNKIHIPITLLYSMSTAQIAYRLIFYTFLRNGTFLLLEHRERQPYFYHAPASTKQTLSQLVKRNPVEIYQPATQGESFNIFQHLVRRYIPIHMLGNQTDNYFNFFCPSEHQFPFVMSMVDNEAEILSTKNSVLWSRRRLCANKSILSLDFRLYNCSLVSLFNIDFGNCAIIYGFELKTIFYNVYPNAMIYEFHKMKILHLPYTFIMDNDTLEVVNITDYNDIEKMGDNSTYIVIMSFIPEIMHKSVDPNYETLSQLFRTNIADMTKYTTRLTLHKNILNSICGMLSTYEINTTILNVVNALSRKIILWVVDSCIDGTKVSFINHKYKNTPPQNLLGIENDSFTFLFHNDRFKNDADSLARVEEIRSRILDDLIKQLTQVTTRTEEEIRQIIDLKINFVTSSLFQVTKRKYYYCRHNGTNLELVSNEHNNRVVQKSLLFLNRNKRIIDLMKRGMILKLSYLKYTFNFPDTRRLLIWYMIQLRYTIDQKLKILTPQQITVEVFNQINNFLSNPTNEIELNRCVHIFFYMLRTTGVDEYFINIVATPAMNLHFKMFSVPERRQYETTSILIPSDKKLLVFKCVDVFFKLYSRILINTP